MKFTFDEKRDLFYAGLMISLAFAILLSGGLPGLGSSGFLSIFIIAFFTAGIGFLLHELMHKYVAQGYGFVAEFMANYKMLWLAILFSFFGFIIAAPGAVYIKGRITTSKNGKISVAGPATNLVLAVLFLIPILLFSPDGILEIFLGFGLTINSLLAAFNMIPTMPFDGAKVIAWDKTVYWITLILGVGLFALSWFV
ncbi:MAG: metalloprotease [Candidatus Pacearchaeota archaeon]